MQKLNGVEWNSSVLSGATNEEVWEGIGAFFGATSVSLGEDRAWMIDESAGLYIQWKGKYWYVVRSVGGTADNASFGYIAASTTASVAQATGSNGGAIYVLNGIKIYTVNSTFGKVILTCDSSTTRISQKGITFSVGRSSLFISPVDPYIMPCLLNGVSQQNLMISNSVFNYGTAVPAWFEWNGKLLICIGAILSAF